MEGYFQDAKGNTITFWIEDPFAQVIYNPGQVFGRHDFTFTAEYTGVYGLVFRNTDIFLARAMGIRW